VSFQLRLQPRRTQGAGGSQDSDELLAGGDGDDKLQKRRSANAKSQRARRARLKAEATRQNEVLMALQVGRRRLYVGCP
jgi:hypothetical protein